MPHPIRIDEYRRDASDWTRSLPASALLESIPEAVFLCDADTRVLQVNTAAEQLMGCSREELTGLLIAELARRLAPEVDNVPVPLPYLAVSRALRGESIRSERRTLRSPRNGSRIEAMISAKPIRDRDDQVLGALVLIRDVTEVHELQRQIAITERHNAIGQLAAGIAHDFRNVLNSIDQSATVLEMKEGSPASDRRTYLQIIHNAVRRGAEIINRVREHVQETGGEHVETDPRQLVLEAIELTRPMWEAGGNISVVKDLPAVALVRGNPADLRRVFTNLIINAVQAMPEGGALVVRTRRSGPRVHIEIADTGVGIPPEQRAKIFYPYFTTKAKGTGLGLSGSQRIITAHGGNISFESDVGKGTTFRVELPAADAANPSHHGESHGSTNSGGPFLAA